MSQHLLPFFRDGLCGIVGRNQYTFKFKPFPRRFCDEEPDLGTFTAKNSDVDTVEECKRRCILNRACISAEFYAARPVECFISSKCTEKRASPKLGDLKWDLTLYELERKKVEPDKCPKDKYNDADSDGICGDLDACPLDPANDEDRSDCCSPP